MIINVSSRYHDDNIYRQARSFSFLGEQGGAEEEVIETVLH